MIGVLAAVAVGLVATASPTQAATTRQQIVNVAAAEIGNSNSNGGCEKYGPCQGYAWCAMFVDWVWARAGVAPAPTTWVATEVGQWGIDRNLFKRRPEGGRGNPLPGDIVVYGEPGSGVGGHVSIVESVNGDGTLTTIGGNESDAVRRSTINPVTMTQNGRHISGYVTPPGVDAPPPAPLPPADLVTAVDVVTRGERYDVFGRTADNRLLQWTYLNSTDGVWHGPTELGGPVISAPAVTVDSTGRYDVFAIGSNHQLIHRIYQNGAWSGWEHLGGVLHYGISVVNPSPGRYDVFGVDTDYHLVQKIYSGGVWSAWNDLGGVLRSAPDVVSVNGRYDVFAIDTDHHLVQKVYYGGGTWSNWNDLGGYLTSTPSVTRRGDRYDVFATGSSHHLVHRVYDGTNWSAWNDLGGVLSAAVGAVNRTPGRYDIFAANTSHHLIQKIYNGQWNSWNTITTTQIAS